MAFSSSVSISKMYFFIDNDIALKIIIKLKLLGSHTKGFIWNGFLKSREQYFSSIAPMPVSPLESIAAIRQ